MSSMLTKQQIEDLIVYCGSSPTHWRDDDMLICCPVHGESNPSCGISYDKQIFHCFSCGASGNFTKLLYSSLPDEFGYESSSPELEKKTWFKANQKARQFLKDRYELQYRELGEKLKYVRRYEEVYKPKTISIDSDTIPLWKIAPFHSGKSTFKYFFDRGFDKTDLQKFMVGYDDENNTVTLPVFNSDNKLVGVIGRYIGKRQKNQRYKIYDHFNRSNYLYPMQYYKPVNDTMVLVEGQFDAIWCHKCCLKNVQAIMTDLISDEQARIISKNCSTVIYIGDNDKRGLEARDKNYEKLKDMVDFKIVDFPNHGKDPCDWSKEELHEMIDNAHSMLNRKIRRL